MWGRCSCQICFPCGFLPAHGRNHHVTNDGTAQGLSPGSFAHFCHHTPLQTYPPAPEPFKSMTQLNYLGVHECTLGCQSTQLVSYPHLCPRPSTLPSSSPPTWNSFHLRGGIRHNENSERRQKWSTWCLMLPFLQFLSAVVKSMDSTVGLEAVLPGATLLGLCEPQFLTSTIAGRYVNTQNSARPMGSLDKDVLLLLQPHPWENEHNVHVLSEKDDS